MKVEKQMVGKTEYDDTGKKRELQVIAGENRTLIRTHDGGFRETERVSLPNKVARELAEFLIQHLPAEALNE